MEEKKMNSQQIEGRNAVMEAFRFREKRLTKYIFLTDVRTDRSEVS